MLTLLEPELETDALVTLADAELLVAGAELDPDEDAEDTTEAAERSARR